MGREVREVAAVRSGESVKTGESVRAGEPLAAALHADLLGRGETVGCAESLTGGQLAALLSGTPGASASFVGGVVSYATDIKRRVLGVTADRVISGQCAEQMATGVRELLAVDWALSTTGVAGPEELEGQPAGTAYVGLAGRHGARSRRLCFGGDRAENRESTCVAAISLLLEELSDG